MLPRAYVSICFKFSNEKNLSSVLASCHKVLLEANRINSLSVSLVQLQFANKAESVNRMFHVKVH